jgi:hypothetical protein
VEDGGCAHAREEKEDGGGAGAVPNLLNSLLSPGLLIPPLYFPSSELLLPSMRCKPAHPSWRSRRLRLKLPHLLTVLSLV